MLILNRFSGYNCSTCAYEQRGLKANLAEMQHIALLPLPQCRKSENAQQMAYDKNLDKAKKIKTILNLPYLCVRLNWGQMRKSKSINTIFLELGSLDMGHNCLTQITALLKALEKPWICKMYECCHRHVTGSYGKLQWPNCQMCWIKICVLISDSEHFRIIAAISIMHLIEQAKLKWG